MRHLIVLLLLTTAVHAETYRNERCGIEFDLPDGWAVGQWDDDWWKHDLKQKDIRCDLGIRPKGWAREAKESDGFLYHYAIEILVIDRPFREVASFGGFTQVRKYTELRGDAGWFGNLAPDEWLIAERGGDARAQQFQINGCQGVRGSTWSRVWNNKHEVGTSTSDVVVLNDRERHSVYIATQVSERFGAELTQIVKTFRFCR